MVLTQLVIMIGMREHITPSMKSWIYFRSTEHEQDHLKILIKDLEFAVAELKAEVYSDTESYLDSENVRRVRIEDDDGETDWLWKPLDF